MSATQLMSLSESCKVLGCEKIDIYNKQKKDSIFIEMVFEKSIQEGIKRRKYNLYDIHKYMKYIDAKKDFKYYIWTKITTIMDEQETFCDLGKVIFGKDLLEKKSEKEIAKIARNVYSYGFEERINRQHDIFDITMNILINTDVNIVINKTLLYQYKNNNTPSEFNNFYDSYRKIIDER